MPAAILANKVPQVRAQAHICGRAFLQIPFAHRDALEQKEAFPVNQVFAENLKTLGEIWQWEVCLQDPFSKPESMS